MYRAWASWGFPLDWRGLSWADRICLWAVWCMLVFPRPSAAAVCVSALIAVSGTVFALLR